MQINDPKNEWLIKSKIKVNHIHKQIMNNLDLFDKEDVTLKSTRGDLSKQYRIFLNEPEDLYNFNDRLKIVLPFIYEISKIVSEILKENFNENRNLNLDAVWMVMGEKGGYHRIHHHNHRSENLDKVSVVVYLKVPDNNIGDIFNVLHKNNGEKIDVIETTPEEGNILIFPKQVLHGTYPQSKGLRQTLNFDFNLDTFYQDIENYITGMPSENASAIMFSNMMSGSTPFQWTNTDAVIKGVDITLHGELLENLSLDMLASHTHGNRDDIDDALFRVAPERLVSTLQWHTMWFMSPLSLEVTSELVGRQSHVSSLQSETATSGYGLLHLGAKWQLTPEFAVSTRISNVTDKYYVSHTAGINRVSGDANIATGEKLPGVGREWQLSLQLAF